MFKVGDEVIWTRARSTWGRIGSERIHGVVEGVTPKRVRIRLSHGIINSLTALVSPERLRKA